MQMFRYFKQSDSVDNKGKITRILTTNLTAIQAALLTRLTAIEEIEPGVPSRTITATMPEVPVGETPDAVRVSREAIGDTFKFHEVNFSSWWNELSKDTIVAWTESAPQGTFLDSTIAEEVLILSLTDGEPVTQA